MYMVLAVISTCISFDLDVAKSFPLRLAAKAITQQLGKLVEANVKTVHATGWIAGIVDGMHQHHSPLTDYGVHMVRRLLESGMGVSEITWSQIVPTAGAMVANQGQAVSSFSKHCHPILTVFSLPNFSNITYQTKANNTSVKSTNGPKSKVAKQTTSSCTTQWKASGSMERSALTANPPYQRPLMTEAAQSRSKLATKSFAASSGRTAKPNSSRSRIQSGLTGHWIVISITGWVLMPVSARRRVGLL